MTAQIVAGGIHLVNSSGMQSAGGVATAAATTPFAIRGRWPISQAEQRPLFSGQQLLATSYDLITETIPINVLGSNHENAVARLQELKRALNTSLFSVLPLLSVLPTASSTIMYSEIVHATVREVTDDSGTFDAWEGMTEIDAEITLTRGSFFGAASLATLFTNTTFTNNGSGNLTALGTLAGDLIYEGSPLNIKIDGPAGATDVTRFWLATAKSRTKTTHTTTVGATVTSASTFSATTIDCTSLLTNTGIDLALFLRMSSVTNGDKAQFAIELTLADAGVNITARTPWSPFDVVSGATMVYAGMFSLSGQRVPLAPSLPIRIRFYVQSIDGTSVGYTVDYSEAVFAYDVAEITAGAENYGSSNGVLYVAEAQNLNGTAWLPMSPPRAYSALSGGANAAHVERIKGSAPRAFSGASLWVGWVGVDGEHATADTLRVTLTHAPLFRSLRGAG